MATVIVAPTEAEAVPSTDYLRYVDHDGALTLISGWTGIDLSTSPTTRSSATGRSAMENITRAVTPNHPANRFSPYRGIAQRCPPKASLNQNSTDLRIPFYRRSLVARAGPGAFCIA
jgi:hypothetical protein